MHSPRILTGTHQYSSHAVCWGSCAPGDGYPNVLHGVPSTLSMLASAALFDFPGYPSVFIIIGILVWECRWKLRRWRGILHVALALIPVTPILLFACGRNSTMYAMRTLAENFSSADVIVERCRFRGLRLEQRRLYSLHSKHSAEREFQLHTPAGLVKQGVNKGFRSAKPRNDPPNKSKANFQCV